MSVSNESTGRSFPAAVAGFLDDAQHIVRHFISIDTYSRSRFFNGLRTRISAFVFIGLYWRFRNLLVLLATGLFAIGSAVYGLYNPAGATTGYLGGLAAIAAAVGTFLFNTASFHKKSVYGEAKEPRKLNSGFLTNPGSAFVARNKLHLSKLVERTPSAHILSVGIPGDLPTHNWIEFDTELSRHLLTGVIKCEKDEKTGRYFHFHTRDILDDSASHRPAQIKAFLIQRRNALDAGTAFFDTRKLSLGKIGVDRDELKCELGTSSYFCSAVTNDAAAKVITTHTGKIVSEDTLKMFPADHVTDENGNKRYRPKAIDDTVGLSNHIGSVVAAVSSDNIPVLCFQNANANFSADRSVLSGSGSLEYSDFFLSGANESGDLCDALRYGMARELLEETGGIWQDSYRRTDRERLRAYSRRIQVAGFYRDFRRGGFPVFVGFCRMEANFATILNRKGGKIWGLESPAETSIDDDLPPAPVKDAAEYQQRLRSYWQADSQTHRRPSDQVLIIDKLLDLEPVRQHFALALEC